MHRFITAWSCLSVALVSNSCAVAVDDAQPSVDAAAAELQRAPIAADFSDCVESIGVEVVPTVTIRPQVPVQFTLAGETGPVTPVVVRTANCGGLGLSRAFLEAADADVDGAVERTRRAVSIVQIGAIIVPPDGTGDVNLYTLFYHTNHLALLAALRYAGVQANPALVSYDYRPGVGRLDVQLIGLHDSIALRGTVGPLDTAPVPFVSNWWATTNQGVVKIATTVPALVISTADLTFQATANSTVASVLGTSASFSVLEQFNGFASAQARF